MSCPPPLEWGKRPSIFSLWGDRAKEWMFNAKLQGPLNPCVHVPRSGNNWKIDSDSPNSLVPLLVHKTEMKNDCFFTHGTCFGTWLNNTGSQHCLLQTANVTLMHRGKQRLRDAVVTGPKSAASVGRKAGTGVQLVEFCHLGSTPLSHASPFRYSPTSFSSVSYMCFCRYFCCSILRAVSCIFR